MDGYEEIVLYDAALVRIRLSSKRNLFPCGCVLSCAGTFAASTELVVTRDWTAYVVASTNSGSQHPHGRRRHMA
jgi:hypothetical protein